MCGWWFSKLGVSASVKECDRDMTGGLDEFGEVTLMLLLRAATCERTCGSTGRCIAGASEAAFPLACDDSDRGGTGGCCGLV